MKKFLILFIGAVLIAFMINCSGGGGAADGAGGPGISPDDIEEIEAQVAEIVSENLSEITSQESPSGDDEGDEGDSSEEPTGNDEGEEDDGNGDAESDDDDAPAAEEESAEEAPAFAYRLDSTAGKWYETPASKLGHANSAIHTYWGNQPLYLRIENVQEAGWYRLAIDAKNNGILPDFYNQFNIAVYNESDDSNIGGIQIEASDTDYRNGSLLVYLPEGDSDLLLKWTNDAYKRGDYDANIQISNVSLELESTDGPQQYRSKLVRHADEYSSIDGRFFWDNNSVRTYWANQTIGFSFPGLAPGKYRIKIQAKNYGSLPLPDDYDYFNVAVEADGTNGEAQVRATEKGWRNGSTVLDLTGGDTEIFFTWLNDKYLAGEYDANIQIHKIQLQRVGDSERSALTAYLLGSSAGNKIMIIGALAFLLTSIICITLLNRRRARFQL